MFGENLLDISRNQGKWIAESSQGKEKPWRQTGKAWFVTVGRLRQCFTSRAW